MVKLIQERMHGVRAVEAGTTVLTKSLLLSAKWPTYAVKKISTAGVSAARAQAAACLFGLLFPTEYI